VSKVNIDRDWNMFQASLKISEVADRLKDAKADKKLINRATRLLKDIEGAME
tara:strand:- start:10455 stop:10610 length:156 start_codon:yes stop_codon:yes gene_type:complete